MMNFEVSFRVSFKILGVKRAVVVLVGCTGVTAVGVTAVAAAVAVAVAVLEAAVKAALGAILGDPLGHRVVAKMVAKKASKVEIVQRSCKGSCIWGR